MFGKGKRSMSSNDRFIMGAGRAAGNLKGRGTAPKSAPATGKPLKGQQAPTTAASLKSRTINKTERTFTKEAS
jgi:hypothetical protein